jgi:hypothetical protein
MAKTQDQQFVVCVDNASYEASLEKRKIYLVLPDPDAEALGLRRVIDESGEDYLYPSAFFQSIEVPLALGKAILAAA